MSMTSKKQLINYNHFTWQILLLSICFAMCHACNFLPGIEYICLPCGGSYSCHGTSTCIANADDVPGCTLPSDATDWFCCEAFECDVKGSDLCTYTAPPNEGGNGGGGGNGGYGDGSGSDSTSRKTLIIVAVVVGVLFLLLIILVLGITIISRLSRGSKQTMYPPLNTPQRNQQFEAL